ncbi:MAG: M50 family metallopeptidase [Bacillota bacterium]|jgi:stage IV sporulation protein FB
MYIGRIMGVNLRVHYLFLLPLLAWALSGQLLQGLLSFLAVLLHELGHLNAARSQGLTPKEVMLLPFGGVATLEESLEFDPRSEMRVALAGPGTNLLLIGVVVIGRGILGPHHLLDHFLQINIVLAFFNLLPALPLDGGRIYRAYLVQEHGYRAGTIRAVRLSRLCSLLFLALGIGLCLFLDTLGLNFLLMSFFLLISSQRVLRQSPYQLLSYLSRKQRELARLGRMSAVTLVVSADCAGSDILDQLVPQRYHLFWVVDRQGRIQGVLSEQQVVQAIFDRGLDITLRQILD